MRIGYVFQWRYLFDIHLSTVVATCKLCGQTAVVRLPDALIAIQPDETTHVCHPAVGGCNQGFHDPEDPSTVLNSSVPQRTGGPDDDGKSGTH